MEGWVDLVGWAIADILSTKAYNTCIVPQATYCSCNLSITVQSAKYKMDMQKSWKVRAIKKSWQHNQHFTCRPRWKMFYYFDECDRKHSGFSVEFSTKPLVSDVLHQLNNVAGNEAEIFCLRSFVVKSCHASRSRHLLCPCLRMMAFAALWRLKRQILDTSDTYNFSHTGMAVNNARLCIYQSTGE